METQRTLPPTGHHPQWGNAVFAAATVVVLGASIAQGDSNASRHHAAASVPPTLLPVVRHPDIRSDHQALLSETLRALPEVCQRSLKNLYVRYDHPSERGLSGKDTIILSGNVPAAELRALFLHEFGHITDLGCLRGTPDSGVSSFRDGPETIFRNDPSTGFYRISWRGATTQKPTSSREDFVSGYAAKDAFEDFAETFAYVILQPEAFATRAQKNTVLQQKLLWMHKHIFLGAKPIAMGNAWNGTIPWDVTKLRYTVYSPHASASGSRRAVARK